MGLVSSPGGAYKREKLLESRTCSVAKFICISQEPRSS